VPETPDSRRTATALPSDRLKSFLDSLWNADEKTLRWVLGVLILILACFNFVRDLNNPSHAFWDESYYLTSAQRYVEGTAQYASHPPLGFMFMKLGIVTDPVNKNVDTHFLADIKKLDTRVVPKQYDFTPIRMPAALFSVVSALLFYLILLKLNGEPFEAFVFSLMYVFENAYIVHFRAAHLDPYQFTFTIGSILVWLYTFGREPKRPLLTYGLFGLLCGLSFMVKVNSLLILLLAGLSLLRMLWMERTRDAVIKAIARGMATAGAFVAAVALVFSLHVVLNPNAPDPNTDAGRKDLHYMPQGYQDFLHHKRGLDSQVVWDATSGYYQYMKHDFTGEIKYEPNGSRTALWPFMSRVINYRWDFDGKRTAYTQMIGNPVNWGLGIIGVVAACVLIFRRRVFRPDDVDAQDYGRLEALLVMYLFFWFFHIYLGTQRVMYIYHYFIGLSLSFFLFALSFRIMARQVKFIDKHRFTILCGLSLLIAGAYLYYAPLTYHQFITRDKCEAYNWPTKVIVCQPIRKPAPKPTG